MSACCVHVIDDDPLTNGHRHCDNVALSPGSASTIRPGAVGVSVKLPPLAGAVPSFVTVIVKTQI